MEMIELEAEKTNSAFVVVTEDLLIFMVVGILVLIVARFIAKRYSKQDDTSYLASVDPLVADCENRA